MKHTIGVVGVGLMGKPIAKNLYDSGFDIIIYDKNEVPLKELATLGLRVAESPKQLMELSEVVLDVLNDTNTLTTVLEQPEGLLEGINGRKIIIDMTTSDPEQSVSIGTALKERDVEYLDCPMTGGMVGAQNRQLIIMAGGKREVFNEISYILKEISKELIYLGNLGSGHYMKLIHNQLSHSTFLAACEAFELGEHLGIDPEAMIKVFNVGNARSYATEVRFPKFILAGTFNAGASFKTVGKDIGLVMRKANSLNFDLPITRATYEYWRYAIETGRGEDDYSTVIKQMEEKYRIRNS